MQCEFSREELVNVDLAIVDRACEVALALTNGDNTVIGEQILEDKVKWLDALHNKLSALIEQASKE